MPPDGGPSRKPVLSAETAHDRSSRSGRTSVIPAATMPGTERARCSTSSIKEFCCAQARDPKTRVNPQRGRSLRLKSQIHVEDAEKTPNQQPRADQQYAGEGEFGNHQSVADPGMPLAAARPAAGILQAFTKGERRDLQRRQQAKEHAGSDRRQQGEERARSHRSERLRARGRLNAWRCASSRVPATARTSPNTAPQQESATLSVSICRSSRERPAPNAARIAISFCRVPNLANCRFERFAHTINITTPTAQASTNRAGLTGSAHVLRQRDQPRSDTVPFRMLALQLFPQRRELSLRALHRRAGLQPSDDLHRVSLRFCLSVSGQGIKISTGVPGAKTLAEIKGCRQHAHHGHRAGCSTSASGPPRWGLKQTASAKSCSSTAWPAERNTFPGTPRR